MTRIPGTATPSPQSSPSADRPTAACWLPVFALALGVAISNGFARFAYGLILPAMQADLVWSYTEAGWINTANALGYVVGAMLAFIVVPRAPLVPLFTASAVVTGLALAASGLTADFWTLTLWRVAAGILGALTFIAGSTIAASAFHNDPNRNALAIATYMGGAGFGMVLSGVGLPWLFAGEGAAAWPTAWFALGGASVLSALVAGWGARQLTNGKDTRPKTAPSPTSVQSTPKAAPVPWQRMAAGLTGYGLFGVGYIVYLTFLVAWLEKLDQGPELTAAVWIVVGLAIMASPFVWRPVLARYSGGTPLALTSGVTALGTVLPVVWPTPAGALLSAAVFGLAIHQAPAAITAFSRFNLPQAQWGGGIAGFTIIFAIGQTVGPVVAGWIGDRAGDITAGIAAAAAILFVAALAASLQRPLKPNH